MRTVLIAAAVITAATLSSSGREPQANPTNPDARLLAGAIDIHVHATPDDRPRSVDAIEVARLAHARGMRAIVLKNHYESTAGIAFLVRKVVPDMQVFAGIDLNLTVGGMNPAAVEHMTKVSGGWGRMVWMSTFDAENQVRSTKASRPFVRVSENGALLPETKAVIAAIAKHGLVLASGHVSAAEALMMFEEGRRVGVRAMVATHGMSTPTLLSVEQAKRANALGVLVEFTGDTMQGPNARARVDRIAADIRSIGVEHAIVSSDLGKGGAEMPVEGFATLLEALRQKGFTDRELDQLVKDNPARLLGLK